MKNSITNYENTFYFNGAALSGVLSVDGSYSLNYEPLNVVGKGFLKQMINSVPTASMSLSRYLTSEDPVLNSTGSFSVANKVNAGLYYKNKYFAFEDGYLSSLGLSCSVGEIPTIETSFDVYGDIGPNFNPSGQKYGGSVFVPQTKNILLTTRNSQTNRIVSFNVDYNMPKNPIYGFGRRTGNEVPIEVHNVFPYEVTCGFTMEIDDYKSKSVFDDLKSKGESSFSIDIKASILNDITLDTAEGDQVVTFDNQGINSQNKGDDPSVFSFSASDAVIVSEQVSSSSDGVMSVNLTYKTYLN
tara:strand:- start:507 stop:1406 length:900 start_codon:yes stop_codon:yes gene_type:complete